ncbi:hypothetical protein RIF25_04565 [Thermosynechococcaceae cyanobacterium BACA0444]|uniref:Core-binding (CB) domain-containing protein n=1 Tax=Pseudocalidococcus azoricus BACA0444 TaxID=2918990 RepID=A0AAE4FRA9_9CYAN|nr:hypothetical protein [Pseudocalidococcus azoricus]MDS3860077.1 hypothetical protein [Pseudocalidococcus azoricus BACA0444]
MPINLKTIQARLDDSANTGLFRAELELYQVQFEAYLLQRLRPRTIRQHMAVIGMLIDYLCWDCQVTDFSQIRRGMVCSQFRHWHCGHTGDLESQVKTSVKKFFTYLLECHQIPMGQDVIKGLEIKLKTRVLF